MDTFKLSKISSGAGTDWWPAHVPAVQRTDPATQNANREPAPQSEHVSQPCRSCKFFKMARSAQEA